MATGPMKQPTHFGEWTVIPFANLPWTATYDCLVKIYTTPNSTANGYDIYHVSGSATKGVRNNCIGGSAEINCTAMRKGDILSHSAESNVRAREIYVLPLV